MDIHFLGRPSLRIRAWVASVHAVRAALLLGRLKPRTQTGATDVHSVCICLVVKVRFLVDFSSMIY